jgi:hypothetical protein
VDNTTAKAFVDRVKRKIDSKRERVLNSLNNKMAETKHTADPQISFCNENIGKIAFIHI